MAISSNELRIQILNIVIGSLMLTLGAAAIALTVARRDRKLRTLLLFGIATTLYGGRLLTNTEMIRAAIPLPSLFWRYVDAFVTYLIMIPGFIFAMDAFGSGALGSLRLMLIVQILYAAVAVTLDLVYGPHTAMAPNNPLVILGLTIIAINGVRTFFQKGAAFDHATRVILAGALIFSLFALNHNLVDRAWFPWRLTYEPLGMFVFLGCLGYAISYRFLANERELLKVNYDLRESALRASAAESQARLVEAENKRQAQELDEARRLQLSMLPREIPQPPGLEIAAYMKPATEVGGDYYDFHLAPDGALTVVIGDATGHGLKAGVMVTAVKSLFAALAGRHEIPAALQMMNASLKQMRLRGLFMALAMIEVKGSQFTLAVAGMPPILIYHAQTGEVKEIILRAPPLGGLAHVQYQQRTLTLSPGDVVALMSDGLPERFNPRGEMFDYERTRAALAAAAKGSPQQIIDALVENGEIWAEGKAQEDDVTFVILKLSDPPTGSR